MAKIRAVTLLVGNCRSVSDYYQVIARAAGRQSRLFVELAAVLFEVWKVATEDQFAWFVGTFEQKMQLKNEQFFDEALTKFTELCDTYEC